ncbi:MAG: YihY/virulence factor BrkB family protein [Solirubrobacteraceae bacterium]
MRRVAHILKRTVLAFYHDQGTQHASAMTYYSLMSLFPTGLLAISLLGLIGQYPETYDAIMDYLHEVAPPSVVDPIDTSLRNALQNKGPAATGVVVSTVIALYGTTGVLESIRRALNVIFRVEQGRSFLHRKGLDILFTFALLFLALATGIFIVVGQGFAEDIAGWLGFHSSLTSAWDVVRWPAALMSAMLGYSLVYYIVPDVKHRAFHLLTPGAIVGVLLWLLVSYVFIQYITRVADVSALYGAFAGAIIVVGWLWLSSVTLLLGAELNHAIEVDRKERLPPPEPPTVEPPAPGITPP